MSTFFNSKEPINTFTSLLVKHLPIAKLSFNKVNILMDAETFLSCPEKIYHLLQVANEIESEDETTEVVFDEPKKLPRKKGSGRIPLTKSRPDIVEATRTFAENSGADFAFFFGNASCCAIKVQIFKIQFVFRNCSPGEEAQ